MEGEEINNILTLFIFVLGVVTVVLSILVSAKFHKYKSSLSGQSKKLSRAVAWQLAGEAVIGFGTLLFATAAFCGVLESWTLSVQSTIRFIMFLATSLTTVHLHRTLKGMSE